jgi:hypothetical protein
VIEDTSYWGLFRGLRTRMRHYRSVFSTRNPSVDAVMADLLKFTRFFATTHEQGQPADEALILEGRRQVMCRILQHTRLTAEELLPILADMDEPTRIALFDNKRSIPVGHDA